MFYFYVLYAPGPGTIRDLDGSYALLLFILVPGAFITVETM